MSDQKKEYEVIRKNCLNYEVGEIVELTDDKAKKLVNKVKLVKKAIKKAPSKKDA